VGPPEPAKKPEQGTSRALARVLEHRQAEASVGPTGGVGLSMAGEHHGLS
jgi:hypothetical protein